MITKNNKGMSNIECKILKHKILNIMSKNVKLANKKNMVSNFDKIFFAPYSTFILHWDKNQKYPLIYFCIFFLFFKGWRCIVYRVYIISPFLSSPPPHKHSRICISNALRYSWVCVCRGVFSRFGQRKKQFFLQTTCILFIRF